MTLIIMKNTIKELLTSIILIIIIVLMCKVANLKNTEIFLAASFCLVGQYMSKLFMYVFNGGRIL